MASTSRESRRSLPSDDKRSSKHSSEKKKESAKPSKCLGVFALSYTTTEQTLEQEFEKYGAIEKINLIVDGFTKRSRGFAFVYFQHLKDAIEAKESMDGQTLDGKELKVDFSLTTEGHKRTPGVYIQRGVEVDPISRVRGGHSYRGRGAPSYRGRGDHYSSRDYDKRDYRYGGRSRDYYDERYRRDYSPSSSRYYSHGPPSHSYHASASRYPQPHPREREDPNFDEEERYYRDRNRDRYRDQDFLRYYEKDRYYERSPPPRDYDYPREYERRGPPREYDQNLHRRDYDRRDSRRDYERETTRGYAPGSPPPLSRRHEYAPPHHPRRIVSRSPHSRHGSPRVPHRRDRSRSPQPARRHRSSPSPLPTRGGPIERYNSHRSLSGGRKKSRSKSFLKVTIMNKSLKKRSLSKRSRSRSLRRSRSRSLRRSRSRSQRRLRSRSQIRSRSRSLRRSRSRSPRRSRSRSSNHIPLSIPRDHRRSLSPRPSYVRSGKSTSPVKRYN